MKDIISTLLFHTVHLNHMLTAGNTVQRRMNIQCTVCVRVRNSVSMETDRGDKGDACLLRSSLSTLTDHNMKTRPIALSPSLPPSLLHSQFLSSSLHMSGPSSLFFFLRPDLFLLIFPSRSLWSCRSQSLCVFVSQGQKKNKKIAGKWTVQECLLV